jgi:hypothetical protein
VVNRISIHPTVKEPGNTSYVWPLRSHVRQPSVKSLLGQNRAPAPGLKSWPSSWATSFSLHTPSLRCAAPPTPAAIVARPSPKVSKVGSPRRHDAVGDDLLNFGEPERL